MPLLMLVGLLRLTHHATLEDYTPVLSDEIFYWHQAVSFQKVGLNTGYYSYAEQPAAFGHFYAWGAFIPLFQGTAAKLFGWSLYAIPLMNALLLSVALAIFIRVIKVDTERLLWLAAALITFGALWLYHLTSMLEVTQYALTVLIAAAFYRLLTKPERTWGVIGLIVILAASLLRPTMGLLFLPLGLLIQPHKTVRSTAAGIALAAGGWVSVSLTAAPYPSSITSTLGTIQSDPAAALSLMLENFLRNLALFNRGDGLEIALRWEIVVVVLVLTLGVLFRRVRQGLSQPEIALHLYSIGAILLLNLVFYNMAIWRDYRVMTPHLLLVLLLLVAYRRRTWLAALTIPGLLMLPQVWTRYEQRAAVYVEPQKQSSYYEWREKLGDVLIYDPDAPNAWCSSVLANRYYLEDDPGSTLLAIPGGFGLSFFLDFEDLALPPKSRYLLFDDGFFTQNASRFHVEPLLDVPGGRLYLNLDSMCQN
jgi:hypothetical protein